MSRTSPILVEQIGRSKKVAAWVNSAGREVALREAVRSTLVTGSIQLTMEHHAAMVCLAEAGHNASVLALCRPVYEAYIWSTWLLRIATDDQLVELAHNRLGRPLERMIHDLDRAGFFEDPMFTTMKPIIDKMNGFVHGGYEHLQHRIGKGSVGAYYPLELVVEALQIADLFAIMALLEGPAIDGDIVLGDRLYAESKAFLAPPGTGRSEDQKRLIP